MSFLDYEVWLVILFGCDKLLWSKLRIFWVSGEFLLWVIWVLGKFWIWYLGIVFLIVVFEYSWCWILILLGFVVGLEGWMWDLEGED